MKRKAVVLGCGMVGSAMVRDLAEDERFDVVAVDANPAALAGLATVPRVRTMTADLSSPEVIQQIVAGCDVALGALPSVLGFAALGAVIEADVNCCDISFMEQDARSLSDAARERGVTAVVDCGVAPGLSNMIVGHVHHVLDRTDSVAIYVGGLPKVREWPFEYKAPFAPYDVIEEYTRPSRLREHGRTVVRSALSEPELLEFPGVGTLEAFNTDGLRSLLDTIDSPNMKEKTLRYPGHVALMRALRECGFFDQGEIDVKGMRVRPRDVTCTLLFPLWTYQPEEEDLTVMRVVIEGTRDNRRERHCYSLHDEYDRAAGVSSMARTTGFPATIVARMVAEGSISKRGIVAPEELTGDAGFLDRVLTELAQRGVSVTSTIEDRGQSESQVQ